MSAAPRNSDRPPPLRPDRDPADNWVEAPSGERFWGRNGAAGLLAVAEDGAVLLQHRAEWSHHGGTWGLPGGARHTGEPAIDGALREALEEAGVPRAAVRPVHVSVLNRDVWTYTTVVADVVADFTPRAGDAESIELRWVASHEVEELELHPGFGSAWPRLRQIAAAPRPVIIVDAANVVGSVPDGWWRDRRGAAERLVARLETLARAGLGAEELGLPGHTWLPRIVAVIEGDARGVRSDAIQIVDAPHSGDDAIVAVAAARSGAVTVVTSDRELQGRVTDGGAGVRGASWLLDHLPSLA